MARSGLPEIAASSGHPPLFPIITIMLPMAGLFHPASILPVIKLAMSASPFVGLLI